MKYIIFIALLCSVNYASSQKLSWGDSSLKGQGAFYLVETAPKFPGGMSAYYKFIADNLKMPENKSARGSNRKMVIAEIIIDKTGKVIFAEIEKGLNENYDRQVLEMLKLMPDWSPALQNKRPVPVLMPVPIIFID